MEVESLRHLFTSVGKEVIVFFDQGEYDYIKVNVTSQDLVLLLSYKGESKEAINILKDLQYHSAKTMVMTQSSNNSMAKLADYQLYVPTESIRTPTKRTYEISTTFYFIIDQLFYDYCLAMEQKNELTRTCRKLKSAIIRNRMVDFPFLNEDKSAYSYNIQEIADSCHVSTTSVFRLCKKLGLTGFSELKAVLKYAKQEATLIVRRDFQELYHQVVDYIARFDTEKS
ncbi:SIS domain-containing protein [Streptococcus iniae]